VADRFAGPHAKRRQLPHHIAVRQFSTTVFAGTNRQLDGARIVADEPDRSGSGRSTRSNANAACFGDDGGPNCARVAGNRFFHVSLVTSEHGSPAIDDNPQRLDIAASLSPRKYPLTLGEGRLGANIFSSELIPTPHGKIERQTVRTVGDLVEYGKCGRAGGKAPTLVKLDDGRVLGVGSARNGSRGGMSRRRNGKWTHMQGEGTSC